MDQLNAMTATEVNQRQIKLIQKQDDVATDKSTEVIR